METKREKFGFTLVELLTVMSVIAILIGILVPALNLVRKMAKDTSQKAQFHSISVSLDIFNGENDGYPDSYVRPIGASTGLSGTAPLTIGAQHLAEALVGRDMLGLDPMTTWNAEWDIATSINTPYASENLPLGSSPAETTKSLTRRKGPYLNPEKVEAYNVGDLYTTTGNVYDGLESSNNAPAPVMTDIYRVKDVTLTTGKTVKAGSPILYYKANTSLTGRNIFPDTTGTAYSIIPTEAVGSIFNSIDNEALIALFTIKDTNVHHKYEANHTDIGGTGEEGRYYFYKMITNPKITSQPRPYNTSTYLLISAGYDGIYGTTDDITNFGE